MRKLTRRAQIPYIIEGIITLLRSSIYEEEELEISQTTLMISKKIEYFKRELRKELVRPDASKRSCDKNAHFKLQLEGSEAIVGAAKLLVWTDELVKEIEQR